jgi:hypothetical protein
VHATGCKSACTGSENVNLDLVRHSGVPAFFSGMQHIDAQKLVGAWGVISDMYTAVSATGAERHAPREAKPA